MKRRKYFQVSDLVRTLAALMVFGLTELLKHLFHTHQDWFFPAYRRFSKGWMKIVSSAVSFTSYAVWDWVMLLLVIIMAGTLVKVIIRNRKGIMKWITAWILILSLINTYGVSVWSLNHYAPSVASEMGLEKSGFTEEELYEAAQYYTDRAAEYALLISRKENKDIDETAYPLKDIAKAAGKSYEGLAERYEVFADGSVKPVKLLTVFNKLMLWTGTSGIFVEFTGESSVPTNNALVDVPHTMCHEAAHRLGIASEEDANFAAYLACENSDDPYFRYSGYYSAFVYLYNKLSEVNKSLAGKLIQNAQKEGYELLFHDANTAAETYARYDTPVKEAGQKVNDATLKSFHEEAGVQSYGLVVDDLIAWYKTKK